MKNSYLKSFLLIKLSFLNEIECFKSYIEFLKEADNSDLEQILEKYSAFLKALKDNNLSSIIKKEILKRNPIFDQIQDEIDILNEILAFDFRAYKNSLTEKFQQYSDIIQKMKKIEVSPIEFSQNDLNKQITSTRTYIFNNDLEMVPVETTEKISFYNLKGYEYQKKILYDNTLALMESKKGNNILLYGDAGCGKSSSVRALLEEFKELRMVQIFKDNLVNLDKLYLKLQNLPYKFVIFADDISFDENDNTLSTMKAILEGSLIARPDNAIIYATSNRRHLVKESFKSRQGDEIHLNDTINEINSLSDRFGINLFFEKPGFDEFKRIVIELAKDHNIDDNNLIDMARKFAIQKGSYAPRVARQLIDGIISNVDVI